MKKKKLTKSEKKRIRKERKEYNKQEDLIVGDSPIFRHKYRHRSFYCPICEQRFDTSDYLSGVFKGNDRAMWLANMVMHYRHNHITSWNKFGDGTEEPIEKQRISVTTTQRSPL